MYERKKVEITNMNKRIGNKKKTNSTYNKPLSRSDKYTGARGQMAKNNDDKLKKSKGRKSFVELAVEQGVYEEIGYCIQDFVTYNPYYSQKELMDYLIAQYPDVFGKSKTEYAQNFYKCIEADRPTEDRVDKDKLTWSECLMFNQVPPKRAVMRSLYIDAIGGEMSHKDKIKLVYLMNDEEDREKAISNSNKKNVNTQFVITMNNEEYDTELDIAIKKAGVKDAED